MKKLTQKQSWIVFAIAMILPSSVIAYASSCISNKSNNIDTTRDYEYEQYCDSIFECNPDYYLDVLVESDEYQDYIEKHGLWWEE